MPHGYVAQLLHRLELCEQPWAMRLGRRDLATKFASVGFDSQSTDRVQRTCHRAYNVKPESRWMVLHRHSHSFPLQLARV